MALDGLGYTPGEGANVAVHSITEDEETRVIERIAPGAGQMGAWEDTATATEAGLVSGLSVSTIGKGRIIVGAICNTTPELFYKFRMVFKNSSGTVMGVSASVSPKFGILTDGTSEYAELAVFANDCGASSAEIYLEALPVGAATMDIMLAAL